MRWQAFPWILFWLLNAVVAAPAPNGEAAAAQEFKKLNEKYQTSIKNAVKNRYGKCTEHNIVRRQEWGTLSKQDRSEYIKAVKCLQKKAPKFSPSEVPGSRSSYDDFVATHIIQTPYIHFSGLFPSYHRYLTWLYERSLQQCGYKGAQPYWDWTISWQDPRKSTVFDGSPYSMGSNGKTIPHNATTINAFGITADIPPATGGGCVTSGPFTPDQYNVTLGPIAYKPQGPDGGLGSNERCLSRDLSPSWSNHTKPSDVVKLISGCNDVECFGVALEDINGVHAGGHFTMGGLGLDAYASAGDPAFWLHHANVDRIWSIWQGQNLADRIHQTALTGTAFNNPPSPNVTLDTQLDFKVLAPKQKVGDLVSTIDGPFCYMYV